MEAGDVHEWRVLARPYVPARVGTAEGPYGVLIDRVLSEPYPRSVAVN
ncbi:hypothetical protein [Streptomyces sp. H27-C3]|nr:hypothetical protein [Streptomyces sp. H27-C3]MDJ0467120.1 hypothetical protein [Streptomyces sp. H27-C3]